jgi:glycosyltransferase involved in cell wall biosynthesis
MSGDRRLRTPQQSSPLLEVVLAWTSELPTLYRRVFRIGHALRMKWKNQNDKLMLDDITPVLLTYNEAANIARTLSRLTWAKDIVVVDCGSDDDTLTILAKFPQVRIFSRPFDTHCNQWRYAVHETAISTPWILRLDADYQLSNELVQELSALHPRADVSAYRIAFDYAIFSQRLISSLYPSNTILLRMGRFLIWDNGHTEGWTVEGEVETLNARVVHDDWKPTDRWLIAQSRYMSRELERISNKPIGLKDWFRRRPPLMPIAVFLYCLFAKGLIFNGKAGVFYALQRLVAEAILSLMLLEQKLRKKIGLQSKRGWKRDD